MGINNVLMKGGHLNDNNLTDILISKNKTDYLVLIIANIKLLYY